MKDSDLDADIGAFANYLTAELGRSKNTTESYALDLAHFREFVAAGGLTDYTAPDLAELSRYVLFLNGKNLGPATVARHVNSVRTFYRFLELDERGTADAALLMQPPKLWQRIPKALSVKAVETLLNEPGKGRGRARDGHPDRDRAILETLYASGCRASELVGLRLTDVNLADQFAMVRSGKGGKDRVVMLNKHAVAAIAAHLSTRRRANSEWLFESQVGGGALTRISLFYLVRRYGERAGYPQTSPHTFRHSFATHVLAGGADILFVKELLGHSSISTTAHYLKVDVERMRAVHNRHHPRAAGYVGVPETLEGFDDLAALGFNLGDETESGVTT